MNTPPAGEDGASTAAGDLEAQAWRWLRLMHSGEARELDAQLLSRWVRRSPAHQEALSIARRHWDALGEAAKQLPRAAAARAMPRQALYGRRLFIGGALTAAATVAGVAMVRPPLGLWPELQEWRADERTVAGEQRSLALAGGIAVILNTRTSIRRQRLQGQTSGLDLIKGEAAIDLTGGRAFTVTAGAGNSRAESCRFEVRNLDGQVCVSCVDGTVHVTHPAGSRTLRTQQQVRYDARSIGPVADVELSRVTAWRQGMLVFDRTPLGEVIHEINRYRRGPVLLMNRAVRARPVSGRFAIASLDLAVLQLQESFSLHARFLPAGMLILS